MRTSVRSQTKSDAWRCVLEVQDDPEALAALLHDPVVASSVRARRLLAATLKDHSGEAALAALGRLARDEDPEIRGTVMSLVRAMPDPGADRLLRRHGLRDESRTVRRWAAKSLRKRRTALPAEVVEELLEREDDARVRRAIARLLLDDGGPAATRVLARLRADPDWRVAWRARLRRPGRGPASP